MNVLMNAPAANSDLPAWLQAFAAIVALFISVWAAWRVGAAERKQDQLQARGIAVAVYPEILKLETTVAGTRTHLQTLVKEQAGKLVGQSISASIIQSGRVSIPPMLDRNTDRLFMLGDVAGPSCLQLVGVLTQYNDFVEAVTARVTMLNANQQVEAVNQLVEHLDLIHAVIAKCKHEVRPLHDAIKG